MGTIKTSTQILDDLITKISRIEDEVSKNEKDDQTKNETKDIDDNSLISALLKRADEIGAEGATAGANIVTKGATGATGKTEEKKPEEKKEAADETETQKKKSEGATGATGQSPKKGLQTQESKETPVNFIPTKIAEEYLAEVNKIVKTAIGTLPKVLLGAGGALGIAGGAYSAGKARERKKDEPEDKAIFAYGQRVGAAAFARALLNKLRGKQSEGVK